MKNQRVAVLMGGDSAEREVSLNSGKAALAALQRKGIDAFALDLRFAQHADSICRQLQAQPFDCAFIALHGRGGEDGVVQAVLEGLHKPYTGCRVAASALAMDKLRSKRLWLGGGLPTPAFASICRERLATESVRFIEQMAQELGFPLMVKPIREGSSIGISKVDNANELKQALAQAEQYDHEILVEQWIEGQELTAGILNHQALPLIRLETTSGFYDYQAKYLSNETQYHCPCGLDSVQEKSLQSLALKAFEQIGGRGWGRIDMMLDHHGQPWLIEMNTVPGLTDHSLVPMAARAAGLDFDELIEQILMTATGNEDA